MKKKGAAYHCKNNAALFVRAFYSGKGVESVEAPAEPEDKESADPAGVDPELLAKILSKSLSYIFPKGSSAYI